MSIESHCNSCLIGFLNMGYIIYIYNIMISYKIYKQVVQLLWDIMNNECLLVHVDFCFRWNFLQALQFRQVASCQSVHIHCAGLMDSEGRDMFFAHQKVGPRELKICWLLGIVANVNLFMLTKYIQNI